VTQFIKNKIIAQRIVFVDGIAGSGKSILGPVLYSLQNMEKPKMEQVYEYLCILHHFKKIESDAAVTLMRLYADLSLYNSLISRDVNLRIFDVYGLLNLPYPLESVARLFRKDGNAIMETIKKNTPVLHIISHQMLPVIDLAFASYGERLRVIEMLRHPLYYIHHWSTYIDRYGRDAREFTLWLDYKGNNVPWFAHGWEEKFLSSNMMDKIIFSIEQLINGCEYALNRLGEKERNQIVLVPFELFVKTPWIFIEKIEDILGVKRTALTQKTLSKQKCPRSCISAGLGHKAYGWRRPVKDLTDCKDYESRRKTVEAAASKEALRVLDKLSSDYEKKYKIFDFR
jgi:hypothetical protein